MIKNTWNSHIKFSSQESQIGREVFSFGATVRVSVVDRSPYYFGWDFPSLLTLPSLSSHLPQCPPQSTSLFLFRKSHASHGCQQSMTYKVEVTLSSSPCLKAGKGSPLWGIGSPKPAETLGPAPAPTPKSLTSRPSYPTVTHFLGMCVRAYMHNSCILSMCVSTWLYICGSRSTTWESFLKYSYLFLRQLS